VADSDRQVAWLSLDKGDNDPASFLSYLVAALQTIASNNEDGALRVLRSPQPPPTESVMTALLNDVTTFEDDPLKSAQAATSRPWRGF
jgi:LuxR family transcriptional regulator, maltose regulon positive regulatory protein